jgi:hypothetical protein
MKVLIIGSNALNLHTSNFRVPKDIDIIATFDDALAFIKYTNGLDECDVEIDSGKKIISKGISIIEAEVASPGSNAEELLEIVNNTNLISHNLDFEGHAWASPEVCYALKMSHRYLKNSPHFLKTMADIWTLRELLGTKEIDPRLKEWYKRREKETYNYKHPSLKRNKANFFNPTEVLYKYDHDSIHKAVAQTSAPAYTKFATDNHEVLSDREKFFSVGEYTRLCAVLEESYVLALERSQIPYGVLSDRPLRGLTPRKSFNMALEKVCTSITSGWFREYAWENYYAVAAMYSDDYINQFKVGLDNGIVIPFTGQAY